MTFPCHLERVQGENSYYTKILPSRKISILDYLYAPFPDYQNASSITSYLDELYGLGYLITLMPTTYVILNIRNRIVRIYTMLHHTT